MSLESKIISFFLRYPEYFIKVVSEGYPFNQIELRKYKSILNWESVSYNKNINWNKDFLHEFNGYLQWRMLSHNPSVFCDVQLINMFSNEILWQADVGYGFTIASNKGVPWSIDLVEAYEDRLDFVELSDNKGLFWSIDLIDWFWDKWNKSMLSTNDSLPWSLSFFEKYFDPSIFGNFLIGSNESLFGDFDIVDKYKTVMNSFSYCRNPKLPWASKNLIDRWGDYIDWVGIAANEAIMSVQMNFNNYFDNWFIDPQRSFAAFSGNPNFPWKESTISGYSDLIDWRRLSCNPGLPWSIELIEKFDENFIWGGVKNELHEDASGVKSITTLNEGLVSNRGLPWSIDFILHFEEAIDTDMLIYNDIVWDLAFKQHVDERLISKVAKII